MVEWTNKSIETPENKEVSDSSRECILFDDMQRLQKILTKLHSLDDLLPTGARELSWSYSSLLSAVEAREGNEAPLY